MKKLADPTSRSAAGNLDAIRKALADRLTAARSAAEKEDVKTVVVYASFGPNASGPLPGFLHETLMDTFDGGPTVAAPLAAVKAMPAPLNPANLSRLMWPFKDIATDGTGVKGSKKVKDVPTVLAAFASPTPDGIRLALTLLDGTHVLWEDTLTLSRHEVASLPVTPPLNQKVLAFAVQHKGEQVGNGECWTLADEALKSAGAAHPDTYVWGRPLAGNDVPMPGDIMQLNEVRLEKAGTWVVLGEPRHTALIKHVRGSGVYDLIHQNFGAAGRRVHEFTVDLTTKTKGDLVIYRPLSPKGQ